MSRARMERERFSALEHLQAAVATSVSLVPARGCRGTSAAERAL